MSNVTRNLNLVRDKIIGDNEPLKRTVKLMTARAHILRIAMYDMAKAVTEKDPSKAVSIGIFILSILTKDELNGASNIYQMSFLNGGQDGNEVPVQNMMFKPTDIGKYKSLFRRTSELLNVNQDAFSSLDQIREIVDGVNMTTVVFKLPDKFMLQEISRTVNVYTRTVIPLHATVVNATDAIGKLRTLLAPWARLEAMVLSSTGRFGEPRSILLSSICPSLTTVISRPDPLVVVGDVRLSIQQASMINGMEWDKVDPLMQLLCLASKVAKTKNSWSAHVSLVTLLFPDVTGTMAKSLTEALDVMRLYGKGVTIPVLMQSKKTALALSRLCASSIIRSFQDRTNAHRRHMSHTVGAKYAFANPVLFADTDREFLPTIERYAERPVIPVIPKEFGSARTIYMYDIGMIIRFTSTGDNDDIDTFLEIPLETGTTFDPRKFSKRIQVFLASRLSNYVDRLRAVRANIDTGIAEKYLMNQSERTPETLLGILGENEIDVNMIKDIKHIEVLYAYGEIGSVQCEAHDGWFYRHLLNRMEQVDSVDAWDTTGDVVSKSFSAVAPFEYAQSLYGRTGRISPGRITKSFVDNAEVIPPEFQWMYIISLFDNRPPKIPSADPPTDDPRSESYLKMAKAYMNNPADIEAKRAYTTEQAYYDSNPRLRKLEELIDDEIRRVPLRELRRNIDEKIQVPLKSPDVTSDVRNVTRDKMKDLALESGTAGPATTWLRTAAFTGISVAALLLTTYPWLAQVLTPPNPKYPIDGYTEAILADPPKKSDPKTMMDIFVSENEATTDAISETARFVLGHDLAITGSVLEAAYDLNFPESVSTTITRKDRSANLALLMSGATDHARMSLVGSSSSPSVNAQYGRAVANRTSVKTFRLQHPLLK